MSRARPRCGFCARGRVLMTTRWQAAPGCGMTKTRPVLDESHSLRLAPRSPVLRVAAAVAIVLVDGAVALAGLLVAGVVVEAAAAADGGGVDAAAGACRFMNLSPRVPLLSPILCIFGSVARRRLGGREQVALKCRSLSSSPTLRSRLHVKGCWRGEC